MQSNSLNKQNFRTVAISSRVIGILVLVFVELMFFSALLSSFFVMKRGRDIWNAAGSIHLPVLATGFNTLILLASGLFVFLAGKAFREQNPKLANSQLFRSIALSGFFLAFQSFLGFKLINEGLTLTSSVFGGCFYLMVGFHLIQVLIGILLMLKLYQKTNQTHSDDSDNIQDLFNSLQVFWLFVIGLWPVLYAEIYF